MVIQPLTLFPIFSRAAKWSAKHHSRIYNWFCFRIGLRRNNYSARHSWCL